MAQGWQWAQQIGSFSLDWGMGKTDKNGTLYFAGGYKGMICHFQDTSLTANGYSAIFLAAYDNTGQELWVQRVGYAYTQDELPSFGDIAVDNNGCFYVTGGFFQSAYTRC